MLDLNIFLWAERDRMTSYQHDYDYIIMAFGIPAIGVLCKELPNQVRNPESVKIKLPTSEIVQNLSLMVAFLNWVKPTSGN